MTPSSEIPPNLCDLSVEIVEMIVKNLDFTRRMIVRKTCKTLRDVVNRRLFYCKELKITIGLEECELKIEGHSIKYKRSDEGTQSMLTKMMDDLSNIFLDPKFQLDTLIIKHKNIEALPQIIFSKVFEGRVPRSLSVRLLVVEGYENWRLSFWREEIKSKEVHMSYIRILEKLEDDIMRVEMRRMELSDGTVESPWNSCTKYYREGQTDILVDEPSLLPPKKVTLPIMSKPVKSLETSQETWDPYFSINKLNKTFFLYNKFFSV